MQCRRLGFNPWFRKIPRRRKGQPSPEFLPGEFHGQRSLLGFSPWSHRESDTTEQLTHEHILPIYIRPLRLSVQSCKARKHLRMASTVTSPRLGEEETHVYHVVKRRLKLKETLGFYKHVCRIGIE